MPRNPNPEGHANTTDGVRRAAADINLAARQLQQWMADPYYLAVIAFAALLLPHLG